MMIRRFLAPAVLAALTLSALPAQAEVVAKSDAGFVIKHSAEVAADPKAVWKTLIAPAKWWSSEHTYSGDAANLYLDSQATGCFCEKLPKPADAPTEQRMGSVEHMHIVNSDPQRGVLRMKGGLGPLQGEPADGVWTITLKPTASGGALIEWNYAVNGLLGMKGGDIAPLVDKVMGEQFARFSGMFDPSAANPELIAD